MKKIRALIRSRLTRRRWFELNPAEAITSDGHGGLIHITHLSEGPPLITHVPAEHVNEWIEGEGDE